MALPTVALLVSVDDPLTTRSLPTVKLPAASDTAVAVYALYATASIASPSEAPPFNIVNVEPSEEV